MLTMLVRFMYNFFVWIYFIICMSGHLFSFTYSSFYNFISIFLIKSSNLLFFFLSHLTIELSLFFLNLFIFVPFFGVTHLGVIWLNEGNVEYDSPPPATFQNLLLWQGGVLWTPIHYEVLIGPVMDRSCVGSCCFIFLKLYCLRLFECSSTNKNCIMLKESGII